MKWANPPEAKTELLSRLYSRFRPKKRQEGEEEERSGKEENREERKRKGKEGTHLPTQF